MVEDQQLDPKLQLAIAVARGDSISKWAVAHNVPRRTAYYWAEDPKFKAEVTRIRRGNVDRVIGKVSGRAIWAANELTQLARGAESESVKLGALRFMLSDVLRVTRLSNLEKRVDGLEGELSAQHAD